MRVLPVLAERLRRDGLLHTVLLAGGRIRSEVIAFVEDTRRGVSTKREVDQHELGFQDFCNHAYVATDYAALRILLGRLDIDPGKDVFIDIGSGKGRVVMMAAALPFLRVMGIEFSEALHTVALDNIRVLQNPACGKFELVCADARTWRIPHDATVLFFFNPFEGGVLADVFSNIKRSLSEAPRKLTIIYVRPDKFFEDQIEWQSWLTRTHAFPYSDGIAAIYVSRP